MAFLAFHTGLSPAEYDQMDDTMARAYTRAVSSLVEQEYKFRQEAVSAVMRTTVEVGKAICRTIGSVFGG